MFKKYLTKLFSIFVFLVIISAQMPVLADSNSVQVVSTSNNTVFGAYVTYTFRGNTYRSSEAGTAINRAAWRMMSESDKNKVFSAIVLKSTRTTQFGSDGFEEMMQWWSESNEWSRAKQIWLDRIAKREFPSLADYYNASLASLYPVMGVSVIRPLGGHVGLHNEFHELKEEIGELFSMGKSVFEALRKIKGRQITQAVNFASFEIINILGSGFGSAATAGAKPMSTLLGTILTEAGSKALSSASPDSVSEQISTLQALIDDLESFAAGIMNNEIPDRYTDLCNILEEIDADNEALDQARQQEYSTRGNEHISAANYVEEIIEEAKEDGATYIDENRSGAYILDNPIQMLPTENKHMYLTRYNEFCVHAMAQIIEKMNVFKSDYVNFNDDLEGLLHRFESDKQAIADIAGVDVGEIYNMVDYVIKIYSDNPTSVKNVGDHTYRIDMHDKKATDAIGLIGLSFNSEYIYYKYKDQFFSEEEVAFRVLKEKYETALGSINAFLNTEHSVIFEVAELYGKGLEIENQIRELQRFYSNNILRDPSGWWDGYSGAESTYDFFEPIMPKYEECSSSKLKSLMENLKSEFSSARFLRNHCSDYLAKCENSISALQALKPKYDKVMSDYTSYLSRLSNEYLAVKVNYENAISQMQGSAVAIKNLKTQYPQYLKDPDFLYNYFYDGKPKTFSGSSGSIAYVIDFNNIQNMIAAAADKPAKQKEILDDLKTIKEIEAQKTREFEIASGHSRYYAAEIDHLSRVLDFYYTGSSNKNLLALITGKNSSVFENTSQIIYRISGGNIIVPFGTRSLPQINIDHAIEMLEGRTDYYYTLERYEELWDNSANADKEKLAKHMHGESSKVQGSGSTSFNSIAYNTIEGGNALKTKYNELMQPVKDSGADYLGSPEPFVSVAPPNVEDDKVSVNVLNMLGEPLKNSKIAFVSYDQNGHLSSVGRFNIGNIEPVYSENREFDLEENSKKVRVFLWDDNMRPYADLSELVLPD